METKNNSYIEVMQDGIARITSSTPNNISGIYTEGLETGFVIIIVGDSTISMIHATHPLIESAKPIASEFSQHNVRYWTIAYNPAFHETHEAQEMLLKINNLKPAPEGLYLKIKGISTPCSFEATNGFISIDRSGNITVDQKPINIIQPPNKDKRNRINIINNFISKHIKYLISADLQFDGKEFPECSQFLIPPSAIVETLITHSNPYNMLGYLKYYLETYEKEELEKIMKEAHKKSDNNFSMQAVASLNQAVWQPAKAPEHKQSKDEDKPAKAAAIPQPANPGFARELFIPVIGSKKDVILNQLSRITGHHWSANTDGTKFWLTTNKDSISAIFKHMSSNKVGKIHKNGPGITIFVENAILPRLTETSTLKASSTKVASKVMKK